MAGSRAHAFVVAGATLALLAGTPRDSVAQGLPPAIDVVSYEAVVALDVPARSVRGTVSITFSQLTQTGSVTFDSGNLVVDAVREDTSVLDRDRERRFEQRDRKLTVFIDGVADTRTLVVDYHGSPTRGLLFRADPPQAFTIFTTSEWMPCIDAPEDKATLDLTIVTDASYNVVGNGRRGLSGGGKPGQQRTEFVENRPMPSYTFGFAVGDFSEATSARGGIPLRVLGAGPSIDDVQTLFTDTRDAMAFFADRAGVPYPEASYTMVFAGNGVGQELAAFSILPLSAREALFKDPHATLGLHELAHQWWGNLVTCRDWTHFWLNEGFATFMTAAFLEQKSGRDAYDRIAEYWKTRYDQLREAGHDKPLVFPDWNRPTADDRAVVYSKGAYVLSLLRNTMGDDVFWKGLRDYTTKYAGKSVVTADFVKAMEESSGQSLSAFAAQWIYGQ